MKAAIRRRYGTPKRITLEQVATPTPKEKEVLVKVYATTVNRTDCANLTAKPFIMRFILGLVKPAKVVLGTDFAGEVVALGAKVRSVRVGDRVFGFKDTGLASQAEYLTSTEDTIFPMPENIGFKQAAASLEGAHYAYTFLHKVRIKSGQNILINGATGAIGSALLQFVRIYDVQITASCTPENATLIEALGANKTYDYTKEDIPGGKAAYDFIFDTAGKSTFGKCKSLLKKKGVYISSELGPYSQNIFYALVTSRSKKKVVFPIPYSTQKTIPYISEQLKKGTFKPVIDREYALDEISKAYEYVMTGRKGGNVVIAIT